MAGPLLVAYGNAVREGYASGEACDNTDEGTQLKAHAGTAIAITEMEHGGTYYYIISRAASDIYIMVGAGPTYVPETAAFDAGQEIYVPAEAGWNEFGITNLTAGYYTIQLLETEGTFPKFPYISSGADADSMAQPTACSVTPEAFPNKESPPTGDQFSTTFVDNQMSQLVTQYERGTGLESFVPARMTVRGPSNLRSRPKSLVYKVTKE